MKKIVNKQAESKPVDPSPVDPSVDARKALNAWEDALQELEDLLRGAEDDLDHAKAECDRKAKALEFVVGKVVRARNATDDDARRRIIEEQPYDAVLKGKVQNATRALVTSGATDAQISEALKKGAKYPSGYGRGTWFDGARFWIGERYDAAARCELSLTDKELVVAVRRVMQIPAPVKAAAKPTAKPTAKTAKGAKPAHVEKKKPPTKSKSGGGIAYRPQTYGQWLSTLAGNLPKDTGVDLGNDYDRKIPDLVKLHASKVLPSEAKQMLIAAGWFDAWVSIFLDQQDETEKLLHFASRRLLSLRMTGALDSAVTRKLKARYDAQQVWMDKINALKLSLIVHTEDEPKAPPPAKQVPWKEWVKVVGALGGPSRAKVQAEPFWKQAHAAGEDASTALKRWIDRDKTGDAVASKAKPATAEQPVVEKRPPMKPAGKPSGTISASDAESASILADDVIEARDKKLRTPEIYPVTVDGRLWAVIADQLDNLGDRTAITVQKLYTFPEFAAAFKDKGFVTRGVPETLEALDEADPDYAGLSVFADGKEYIVGPRSTRRTLTVERQHETAAA